VSGDDIHYSINIHHFPMPPKKSTATKSNSKAKPKATTYVSLFYSELLKSLSNALKTAFCNDWEAEEGHEDLGWWWYVCVIVLIVIYFWPIDSVASSDASDDAISIQSTGSVMAPSTLTRHLYNYTSFVIWHELTNIDILGIPSSSATLKPR
jgi:hypothetical protein